MITPNASHTRVFDASHSAAAFPLGGIGTGNVSLGARGELRDWEIFNKPAKNNDLPNTFFALRTQIADRPPEIRVLEGPIQAPYTASHGYHPSQNAGLPRMVGATLRGEYPIAEIEFEEPDLPVGVKLEAYTPLIPLNPDESGIPCAILNYTITNRSRTPVDLTLVGSLVNPVGGIQFDQYRNINPSKQGQTVNGIRDEEKLRGLFMYSVGIDGGDLDFGSVGLATDHAKVTIKPAWRRGAWYDFLREFWDDFTADGLLTDIGYQSPPEDRRPDTGSLGLVDRLEPGASQTYRFILTWHFPNRVNSWNPSETNKYTRNRYASRFGDAWGVARYLINELPRLETETRKFHDALFSTTLPAYVIDAISANIVPVRSNTCFWLEDGRFYGWEGCFDERGCCAGSCTHVWSYAQTVAFLFPSLEREMRRIEFVIETEPDGYMSFRNFGSFGEVFQWSWGDQKAEPAIDGQMGSIVRAYREWQLSGDKDWLKLIWPGVKRAIDFASMHWDTNRDNVLDGKQHNTYDIEFYGPNPLGSIYYLAGLRAVEALAHVMDEPEVAGHCHTAFEQGSQRFDELTWNGEYFDQRLEDVDAHPYQHGEGCLTDQMLGQLHARILGLGDLLPADHVRSAVQSIFKYNYRSNFRKHVNCQRTYVFNDEAGLIACTWPHGGRPKFPFVYSDEVWTGMEYQAAAHMIYEGWVHEGLTVIKALRDRHDGVRRNPWNEVECGHHYARSMASWAVLLALTGFHCDLGRGEIRFDPIVEAFTDQDVFSAFWSTGKGWGIYTQRRDPATGQWTPEVNVLSGDLSGVMVKACGKAWKL
ncbi:MAG: GH116 family glycosyl-hydrolase [Aggregatilineales bacterium]